MNNDPTKQIGLMGAGQYSDALLKLLIKIPQVKVLGLCEVEIDSPIAEIANTHAIPIYSDASELFKNNEVDWLINVTNHSVTQYHFRYELPVDLTVIDRHVSNLIYQVLQDFSNFFPKNMDNRSTEITHLNWKTIVHIVNAIQPVQHELEHIAFHDKLTGLYNRNIFLELLEREISRSYRQISPIALATIDIDHFKNVNDSLGHDEGDKILKRLGDIFRDLCRRSDIAARYGGEEFVVVLPNTDIDSAIIWCERMRMNTERLLYRSDGIPVTISLGVIGGRFDGKNEPNTDHVNPNTLLKYADEMLYNAKREGRNRVASMQLEL